MEEFYQSPEGVKTELTRKRLVEVLDFNPETGTFTWKVSRRKGLEAGVISPQGYRIIRLDDRNYRAHRLAWLWVYRSLPPLDIDHINGNRSDNRISNLRVATRSQNLANSKIISANSSGYKGVSWISSRKKWSANISVQGKNHHLGYFASPQDAHEAYKSGSVKFFGEYARES